MTSELRRSTDKRVIRTKKAIKNALFSLMEKKDISSITICELTDAANVNRRTFYTHYRTITDILDEIENDLIAALTAMLAEVNINVYGESIEKLFLRFHSIITEEFDYYFHLMKLDTRAFLQARLKKAFAASAEAMFKDGPALKVDEKLTAAFIAGGLLAFYNEWYYSTDRISPEQAAKLVSKLSDSSIEGRK